MICVSIADVNAREALEILEKTELAELRLDRIEFSAEDIPLLFSGKSRTIATYRPCEKITEDDREKILIKAVEAGASMVDVEVENSDEFKNRIVQAAVKAGCKVIISYHDYAKTPVIRELEQVIRWCFESGADIAKIACQADSAEDSARLLSLYSFGKPLISLGMGEAGKITRIAAPLLGAPFTYGSLDNERKTAPGQIESGKLEEIIRMIRES